MKTTTFTDRNGTFCGYRGQEWEYASFGSEELQLATPQDVERYRGRSALSGLERVLFILSAQTRWNRK